MSTPTNAPGGRWYSTPAAQRRRPPLNVTISPEAHEALDRMAAARGLKRSAIVEDLILEAARAPVPQEPTP